MMQMQLGLRQQSPLGGVVGSRSKPAARSRVPLRTQALFGWGEKKEKSWREIEREEQIRVQQEVLTRRKTGAWQQEVRERRAVASRYMRDPDFKKQKDAENRAKFKARMEQEAKDNPEPRFGIIVPMAPFGMPEYDGGERFDLRLPYVDNGWVDEDADFLKQVGRFFGGGKKERGKAEPKKGKK